MEAVTNTTKPKPEIFEAKYIGNPILNFSTNVRYQVIVEKDKDGKISIRKATDKSSKAIVYQSQKDFDKSWAFLSKRNAAPATNTPCVITIVPNENGDITFTINRGSVPPLMINGALSTIQVMLANSIIPK